MPGVVDVESMALGQQEVGFRGTWCKSRPQSLTNHIIPTNSLILFLYF